MADYITRDLPHELVTFEANKKKTINIPLDRFVSATLLRLVIDYTTGAAGSVAENGILNLIKQVSLRINGKVKRSFKPKHYWPVLPLDLGTEPERVDVTATNAANKKATLLLPIFFRADPADLRDLTMLLPARYLSSADIQIEFADAASLGNDHTINSGEVSVFQQEYELTAAEEIALYGVHGDRVVKEGSGLLELIQHEVEHQVDAQYSDFGFPVQLPMGMVLRRTLLTAILNGARSDALASAYRIHQESPRRLDLAEETWEQSQARDRQEYGYHAAIEGDRYYTGFTVADYDDWDFIDGRGRKRGDYRIDFTTAAPNGETEIVALHEQVQPVAF